MSVNLYYLHVPVL